MGDVSEKIKEKLDPTGVVPWRFCEHSESKKLFAENVEERDAAGRTALHRAACKNLPEVAIALIEAGVDVNAVGLGYTALLVAVAKNHLQIGRMLIDVGADVTAEVCGWTPLNLSKYYRHGIFAEMLQNKIIQMLQDKINELNNQMNN